MRIDRKSRSSSKAPFLTGLTLAVSVFLSGNLAAGVPVTVVADVGLPSAITTQINTYMQQVNMIAERSAEIQREVKRIQDLATQVSSLAYGLQGMAMTPIKKRDADYGMERCSPDTGFSLGAMFDLVMPKMTESAPEQQRKLCMQITRLENEKFNESFRILELLKDRTAEIKRLESQLKDSDSTGKVGTNVAQAATITSQLLTDIQYSNAIVKVYEGQIGSLTDDQKYIAQEAFAGPKKGIADSLLSTAAQTVTLCGGLLLAKSSGSDFSCGL